ncbi:MAG: 6-hydroxymethylpterin diphosphokinase MptE-like protein [Desulfurivibrionaceae bacterium]
MNANTQLLYEKNLSLLHKFHPRVWQQLQEDQQPFVGEVFTSPAGKPNLQAKNELGQEIIFHGSPEPDVDSISFLNKVSETDSGVVIITGFGLGYSPMALVQERPLIRKFVFFEPITGIFKQALAHRDLSPLLTDPRVILNIGQPPLEDIESALEPAGKELQMENAHLLHHMPSFSFSPIYETLAKKIYNYANLLNVNGATILKQARNFLNNRFQNFTIFQHHRLLTELQGAFTNIPAILVAAGPSLDKNIEQLKAVQDKALILAVDTALPALLSHGIIPHFVAAIDGDEVVYEKIAACASQSKDINLLCQAHATSKIAKTFPAKKIFWGLTDNRFESWFYESLFDKENQNPEKGAWSVAHFNLSAALNMQANPIIFIGQDLAFTDNKSHAGHTVLTGQNHMEDILTQKKDDVVWVEGWGGSKIPTTRGLYGVKLFFEEMMAQHEEHLFINATEGGAILTGAEHLPLAEALKKYCTVSHGVRDLMVRQIEKCPPPPVDKFTAQAKTMFAKIQQLQKSVQKILTTNKDATKKLEKTAKQPRPIRQYSDLSTALQKSLLTIEKLNRQIEQPHALWVLLSDLTMQGLKESERLKYEISTLENGQYQTWLQKKLQLTSVINNARLDALIFFGNLLEAILNFQNKEKSLLLSISTDDKKSTSKLLELTRLYFSNGYYTLAAPIVDHILAQSPDYSELLFYKGCIASEQREEELCRACFNKALAFSPDLSATIKTFRRQQGDNFIEYAEEYRSADKETFKNLLFKGLAFCPDHPAILKKLGEFAQEELKTIDEVSADNANKLTREWHHALEQYPGIAERLTSQHKASLFHHYGCLNAREQNYDAARQWISQAIALQPDNPEFHASMVSVFFELGDYGAGLTHLKEAVKIDRTYASNWEEIGDSLFQGGQHDDALAAYEQCLIALPDHLVLLKKMGDCYMALEQLEAAEAAYLSFKEKMSLVG